MLRSASSLGSMAETEYYCTRSAHSPESLTLHMNHVARDGWELVAVNFAHRGETGYHTFFWQRPRRLAEAGRPAGPREE